MAEQEQEQTADIEDIQAKHAELLAELDALKAKRDFFQSDEGQAVKDELERICKEREGNYAAELRYSCKPADTPARRASANAYSEMGRIVTGLAWDEDIAKAEAALETFEADNALLLGDAGPDPEKIKIVFGRVATAEDTVKVEALGFDMTGASAAEAEYSKDRFDAIMLLAKAADWIHEVRKIEKSEPSAAAEATA